MARIRITDDDGVVAAIISVSNGYQGRSNERTDATYDGYAIAEDKAGVRGSLMLSVFDALGEARSNDLIAKEES